MNEEHMVYRGDPNLIHIADGQRIQCGEMLAATLDVCMRAAALESSTRTFEQIYGEAKQPLCPGCYMTVIYNTALTLAERNGQNETEMADTMIRTFKELKRGIRHREYVTVMRHQTLLDGLGMAVGAAYGMPLELMM